MTDRAAHAGAALSARQLRYWVLERLAVPLRTFVVCRAAKSSTSTDARAIAARLRRHLARLDTSRVVERDGKPMLAPAAEQGIDVHVREVPNAASAARDIATGFTGLSLARGESLQAYVLEGGGTVVLLLGHRAWFDESSLESLIVAALTDAPFTHASYDEPDATRVEEVRAIVDASRRALTEPAELPCETKRPARQGFTVDHSLHVSRDIAKRIDLAAGRLGVSSETLWFAGFALTACRYGRSRGVIVGRRTNPPRSSMVPVFLRFGEGARSAEALRATGDAIRTADALSDVSFERLLEVSRLAADASRSPLFQLGFSFRSARELPGDWSFLFVRCPGGERDLDLDLVRTAEGVTLEITASRDVFTHATRRERFAEHVERLTLALAEAPERPLTELDMLSHEERSLLALPPRGESPSCRAIHARVHDHVVARPSAVAVVQGDLALTYEALWARSGQIAAALQARGVRPEDRVVVCLDRTPMVIVALLGVLRSGGAYVPIEPTTPAERAAFIATDAKPSVILTERRHAHLFAAGSTLLLFVDGLDTAPAEIESPELPSSLAYVIYTSGSTGQPKGCLVEHRHVGRLLDATWPWFRFDAHDVWTMFHSVAFDFSVWEIWGALTTGGRLVVVPHAITRAPDAFVALCESERVTILNQTPSAFRAFIESDAKSRYALALRTVIFGGEALEFESLRPWFDRHGDTEPELVNMYGITETTVHVTYRSIRKKDLEDDHASLIGVPIPDLTTYVVDAHMNLVPFGVPGELVVSGAGVSRGYLNRPELTASRFADDPWNRSLRLYRSGDLVRRLENGELDYLGRIDAQVKIRGFRIELGELEAAARRSGLVKDAAALTVKNPRGEAILVLYCVSEAAVDDLRAALKVSLPDYMVPSHIVLVPTLTMTENGKLDRQALPEPWNAQVVPEAKGRERAKSKGEGSASELESVILSVFSEILRGKDVDTTTHFFDAGGTSLDAVYLSRRLEERLGRPVSVVAIFDAPTPTGIAKHLGSLRPSDAAVAEGAARADEVVAIVGVAGRFPGANDVDAFWKNLCDAKDTIARFTDAELDPSLDPAVVRSPLYVKARGILDDVASFDADFFGMSPREAEVTDPQQRIALEVAWHALEAAGCDPSKFEGAIGVYCGEYNVSYYTQNVLRRPDVVESVGEFQAMVGNEKDFIATRIAHKLDLRGPAVSIHTACSTSLVASVEAFHSLVAGRCDVALAGGVAITFPPKSGYTYQEGGMLSVDGRTRPFDRNAAGTVFGDGAAFVVMKRLSDAIRDKDDILALVRAGATNNDGAVKMSFTAPSARGQAEVISRALTWGGIDPETIGYVEAHGTGTPLGDPIEIEGLSRAFRQHTQKTNFCGVGSVKSNIGHLVAAAGATGLIKAALTVKHGVIPPTLHFEAENPKCALAGSPFYVVDAKTQWPASMSPRRAGVSSFGVGGTNAHVIVEEPPALPARSVAPRPRLFLWSARTPEAVARLGSSIAGALAEGDAAFWADAEFTLARGRKGFSKRRFAVASSPAELPSVFADQPPVTMRRNVEIAFAFPGQGSQYLGMGSGLASRAPVFREALEACVALIARDEDVGADVARVLYASPDERASLEPLLVQTKITQPALFAVEYANALLWRSLGVTPSIMIGHSLGEFVAACLAGVFSLEDALALVVARGRLMQSARPGVMLSVRLTAEEAEKIVPEGCGVAVVNAPKSCVVGGPNDAITVFEATLTEQGVASSRLRTSHAFHSPMMDEIVPKFLDVVRSVRLSPPSIPIVSTVTTAILRPEEATDPMYWARHVRSPVRFSDALRTLWQRDALVVEVGPRSTLATLAKQIALLPKEQLSVASLDATSPEAESAAWLRAVGQLWALGAAIDLAPLFEDSEARKIPLAPYPFTKTRHYVDPPMPVARGERRTPEPGEIAAPTNEGNPTNHAIFDIQTGSVGNSVTESRREEIRKTVSNVFEEASGIAIAAGESESTFMELGLDSLLLTQCAQLASKRFQSPISFRQLMEDLTSVDALTTHLEKVLPAEAFVPKPAAVAPVAVAPVVAAAPAGVAVSSFAAAAPGPAPMGFAPNVGSSDAMRIVAQQLDLMSRQLELLRGAGVALPSDVSSVSVASPIAAIAPAPRAPDAPVASSAASSEEPAPKKPFGPGARIDKTTVSVGEREASALSKFIAEYLARTGKSKSFTEQHRAVLADPRVVTGFRPLWKEIVYPIVADRSDGAYIWDVDGNRYVDVTCGFGANFLGHRPPFVVEAVHAQLERGFEIGPQHPLVADCAANLRALTGHDRVIFCSTGSEAVLGATRLARTVTGRAKIVSFTGDYHGILDEVIVRGTKALRSLPGAPGINRGSVENNLILEYGDDAALEIIAREADDIAAVLVEPVQSRKPELQPRAFLQKLRELTKAKGIALIFDEIITGFRLCPGGAQQYFGVKADIATYGKILGGGLPIGAIAGEARFMDALDGGPWRYGDASIPEIGVTYFAGTFVRHPLALAACKASLGYLIEKGPRLQADLNEKTAHLVAAINAHSRKVGAPYSLETCSSWFKLSFPDELLFGGLLFFWLRNKGIHIWDGRVAFLTTAHSDEDIEVIRKAFVESLDEMMAAGFFVATSSPVESANRATAPAPPEEDDDVSDDAPIPTTPAQREIWLAAELAADTLSYNESITLTCRGAFDQAAMTGAIQALAERHESLRATFSADGFTMRVADHIDVPITFVDVTEGGMEEWVREERVRELTLADATSAYDLETGPLFRGTIVRVGPEDHRVILSAHHIVCDGWSFAVLLKDLGPLYSSKRANTAPTLDRAYRFRNYARTIERRDTSADEAYWLGRLRPEPEPLDLPTDRSRSNLRSNAAGRVDVELPIEVVQAVKKAGAKAGASFFGTLFTAFGVMLARLSGQSDLVIGVPASGQSALDKEMLVGHCVSLLPIRAKFDPSSPFIETLRVVRRHILDAYDHQLMTFGQLLPKLNLPRDRQRVPLVSAVFNLDSGMEGSGLRFDGLEVQFQSNPRVSETFDLFLNVFDARGRVVLECQYASTLWHGATIRAWLEGYVALLSEFAKKPEAISAELPLIGDGDRRRMLVEWNAPPVPLSGVKNAVDFVFARAERDGARIALSGSGQSLTYAELAAHVRGMAAKLALRGVRKGDLVGICLERTPRMVVAILATLEAGAAYVPIDPEYPASRVGHMVENARLVIGEDATFDALPSDDKLVVSYEELVDSEMSTSLDRPTLADRAYVIFTSGSTGTPKGVEVTHDNLVNFVESMLATPGMSANDTLVSVVTLSFDMAGFEIYVPLAAGARIVVADRETALDGRLLAKLIEAEGATALQATPSTFRLLRAAGAKLKGVKVILGGEPLPPDLARWLIEEGAHVWNGYGPTETTIFSTIFEVTHVDGAIPIGRPIGNTRTYVLGTYGELVPIGVYGELYIGGKGVASGYLQRPDATAERFTTDPFVNDANARMYQTGDVVRWRHDGVLEYRGRNDDQIKLRGHRIELGEIDQQLSTYPDVAQGATVVIRDDGKEARLSAFIVLREGASITATELRRHLRRKLPDAMIPQQIVELPELPQTPNGKIDKRALSKMAETQVTEERELMMPRTEAERFVYQIVSDAVGVKAVSMLDNFFDLGGDSLTSMEVAVQIERAKGVRITPRRLLLSTLEEVAREVAQGSSA